MEFQGVMDTLEEMGTAQNRKIYTRHGAKGDMFGVSFSNLNKLKKKIKKDHDLGVKLWNTGNVDAMSLATMIVDPKALDEATLDEWLNSLNYYMMVDLLVGNIVTKTPYVKKKMEQWIESDKEYVGQAGWQLLSHMAQVDDDIPDDFFLPYIKRIEETIHTAKNRVKHSMNGAIIGIGMHSDAMEIKAIEAAERIGKVAVDHGDTSCKTPEAIPYIKKARAHKKKKQKKI